MSRRKSGAMRLALMAVLAAIFLGGIYESRMSRSRTEKSLAANAQEGSASADQKSGSKQPAP